MHFVQVESLRYVSHDLSLTVTEYVIISALVALVSYVASRFLIHHLCYVLCLLSAQWSLQGMTVSVRSWYTTDHTG